MRHAIALSALLLVIPACAAHHHDHQEAPSTAPGTSPATAPAVHRVTDVNPELATGAYWWDKPGIVSINYGQFQPLWDTCEDIARSYLFDIDRIDYRLGVLTTRPMTSKQFFELWRHDVATASDLEKSSLATYRRTLRFDIAKKDDGTYQAVPKVLVERYWEAPRRITAFVGPAVYGSTVAGTNETDQPGVTRLSSYWYAVGRDSALERKVADDVENKLR